MGESPQKYKNRRLMVSVSGSTGPGTWLLSNSYQKQPVRPDGQRLVPRYADIESAVSRFLRRSRGLQLTTLENIIRPNGQPVAQIFCNIKVVLLAGIQQVFVLRVLGNIIFFREERSYALHLQNALAVVHYRQFVSCHEFFATMSSEEFILFAFSYTESCKCSINVLN